MKRILAGVVCFSLLLVMIGPFTVYAQTGPTNFNKPLQRLFNDNSLNWSGYYVTDSSGYTSASSSWTVPTVATSSSGYSSAWVGIGGVSGTGNLIQTGTDQDCTTGTTTAGELKYHGLDAKSTTNGKGSGGGGGGSTSCKATYYAWYEAYPAPEVKISNFNVSPGNVISASVQQVSGGWSTTITNVSTGQTFTATVNNFNPDMTTAEVIMERPALCSVASCKLTNLANFGQVQFTGATATSTTSSTFDLIASDKPITMVDNSFKVLALPGPISNPGTFTDTWKRSS